MSLPMHSSIIHVLQDSQVHFGTEILAGRLCDQILPQEGKSLLRSCGRENTVTLIIFMQWGK